MSSSKSLVVIVTGASSGIGQQIAIKLASRRCSLVLISHKNIEGLKLTALECSKAGARVMPIQQDVSDATGMNRVAEKIIKEFGRVDVIYVNAGRSKQHEGDEEEFDSARKDMNVNYFGALNTVLPFIPTMLNQNSGSIAFVSSISSLRATHNSGTYSASKAAISIWSESLRLRLRHRHISVTNLVVGFVDTEINSGLNFWMPGLMKPQLAAKKIIKAVDAKKQVYTLPWQSGYLFWVFRLIPTPVYTAMIDFMKHRQKNH